MDRKREIQKRESEEDNTEHDGQKRGNDGMRGREGWRKEKAKARGDREKERERAREVGKERTETNQKSE